MRHLLRPIHNWIRNLHFLYSLWRHDRAVPRARHKLFPRLEDWFITESDLILGRVFNHPTIADGEIIRTSRVVALDHRTGVVTTKNTDYILGKPAPQGRGNGKN